MRLLLNLKLQFLTCILVVIGFEHPAFAQPNFDGRLIGEWIGASEGYSGDKAVISQNSMVLNGQAIPLRFLASGVFIIGAPGEEEEMRYTLSGDTLTVRSSGETSVWKRASQQTMRANPLERKASSGNTQNPSPVSIQSNTAQRPSSGILFKEHKITDPGMNNVVASTVLVPEDWTVEGGLNRPSPQLYSIPVLVDIKFTAPDGRQAHFFPSLVFDFDLSQPGAILQPTMQGNLNMPLPQSPGAWIMEMSRINPDPEISQLRLVSEEDLPEQTKTLREQNQFLYQQLEQTNQMGMQTGLMSRFDTQATKVVITYDRDGRSYEESILVMWNYVVSTWQGRVTSGLWSIASMLSLRGAAGEDYLNDPELIAILSSVRINPAWQAEMDKYWAQLAQIRHKGNMDRLNSSAAAHQKRMNTLNETSDIIMSGWKSRNESQDRMHAQTIDTIHEQTPYMTPTGETVKLPSFYDNVYTDGNGRYILNNDAFYEPNTDPLVNSQNWQRIEATR